MTTASTITIATTAANGRKTTTVYAAGIRVGYVQHTGDWAQQVLLGAGQAGRFGQMVYYSWPGQPGYICGEIPAELDATVRALVGQQRDQIKAARGY